MSTAILLVFSALANAQYYYIPYLNDQGNPGESNTQICIPAINSQGSNLIDNYGWTLIQGSSSASVWSAVQSLPFSFEFNGVLVNNYKVSSSGILTFDVNSSVSAPDTIPEILPSQQIPDKSVCIWGINASGSNDAIVTKTYGNPPNQEHWIFFASLTLGSGYTYWSIMLEQGSNDIYIVDQRQSPFIDKEVSLGIQIDSTEAVAVIGSPNVQPVSGGTAVSSDDNYYHFIKSAQSIPDINHSILSLYPNPSSSIVNIKTSNSDNLAVEIYDISGKLVQQSTAHSINICEHEPGIYLFKIFHGNTIDIVRVIKK